MSRCFPFPPPGYERKARPDDVNLIIKEKHKEKKHKKDKDKKERSEKKEKERSEDKHREKKDKKDKKHKDKHKHRNSEEKKSIASSEHQNGEKLDPISELASTILSSNAFVELQKRVENDSGATYSRPMVERSDEREYRRLVNREYSHRRLLNGESREINSMGLENGRAFNVPGENKKKAVGDANQVEKVEKGDEGKEKKKHKADDGKKDKHEYKGDKKSKSKDKVGEKEKERNGDMGEKRESSGNLLDVHNKASNKLKTRNSSREILGKRKEPEANGFSCDNEIPAHKLPRPASSSHQIMQNGISIKNSSVFQNHAVNFKNLPSQSVGNGRKIQHGPTANHVSAEQPPAASSYTVNNSLISSNPVPGISKKPTETHQTANKVEKLKPGVINNHKTNDNVSTSPLIAEKGPLKLISKKPTETHQTAHKVEKLKPEVIDNRKTNDKVSTSPRIAESGGKMDVDQLKVNSEVERRGLVIKHAKTDNKGSRVNGVIDPKQHASSSTSSASVKSKEKDIKPPHPDSKYLNQILTVPNVEWPEFDDQEWLFGDGSQAKRPKVPSDQTEGTNVWAEAIPIKSADVIALPYVSPY